MVGPLRADLLRPVQRPALLGCQHGSGGHSGQTYFVQCSDDLIHWSYVPVIETGNAAVIEYGFTCTNDHFFLRLRYTNAATGGNPDTADFDGDGLTNAQEINETGPHTDPLEADTDGDGFQDGLEVQLDTDPLEEQENPSVVALAKQSTINSLLTNYQFLLASSSTSLEDRAWAWNQWNNFATLLQQYLDSIDPQFISPSAFANIDSIQADLQESRTAAGGSPAAPPYIIVATQTKRVSNYWWQWNGDQGGNVETYDQINGFQNNNGFFPNQAHAIIQNLPYPSGFTFGNSSSSTPTASAWFDSQFGLAEQLEEAAESRFTLLANGNLRQRYGHAFVNVMTSFDFRNSVYMQPAVVGVGKLEIPVGGSTSTVTELTHPSFIDGVSRWVRSCPIEIKSQTPPYGYELFNPNFVSLLRPVDNIMAVWPDQDLNIILDLHGVGTNFDVLDQINITWNVEGTAAPQSGATQANLRWTTPSNSNRITVTVSFNNQGSLQAASKSAFVDVPDVGTISEGWAKLADPYGAATAGIWASNALAQTRVWGDNRGHDEVNAMLHSGWNALMASDDVLGPAKALFFSSAHEYTNKTSGAVACESDMDLHNNYVGSTVVHSFGSGRPNESEIWDDLIAKLKNGDLYVVDDTNYQFLLVRSNTRVKFYPW